MESIGKYQIKRELGRGGMGVVYLGFDPELHRQVAIKVLNDRFSSENTVLKRFLQEARLIAGLSHENVTIIHDLGQDEFGHPFIVMEYLEGIDLRNLMAGHDLEGTAQKLDIARQVCRGLHAAHQRNIVHRDVKPANIFIRKDGKVKILDFGIAKSLSMTMENSLTQGTIGTFNYMSPEQIEGQAIDTRSDIFSFGVTLYELITGQKPFVADSPATLMYRIAHEPPRPIGTELLDDTRGIDAIILHCLEKNRDNRYQSLIDVEQDLAALQNGTFSGTAAQPLTPSKQGQSSPDVEATRIVPGIGADRSSAATIADDVYGRKTGGRWLAAAILVAALAFGGWWILRSPQQPPDNSSQLITERKNTIVEPDSVISRQQNPQLAGQAPQTNKPLEQASGQSSPEDMRQTSQKNTAINSDTGTLTKSKQLPPATTPRRNKRPAIANRIAAFRQKADSVRNHFTTIDNLQSANLLATYAPEALSKARQAKAEADEKFSSENFRESFRQYRLAAEWHQRAGNEAGKVRDAGNYLSNYQYQEAITVLDELVSDAGYTVENVRATELRSKAVTEKQKLETTLTAARREMRAMRLSEALTIVDQLPAAQQHLPSVDALRKEIRGQDSRPPVISNTSSTRYNHKAPLQITADIEDQLSLARVTLCYRKKGDDDYLKQPMTVISGKQYLAEISTKNHNGREVQYYFVAEDEIGNIAELWKENREPFSIKRREKHSVPRPP